MDLKEKMGLMVYRDLNKLQEYEWNHHRDIVGFIFFNICNSGREQVRKKHGIVDCKFFL